jgi:hypothetical protein
MLSVSWIPASAVLLLALALWTPTQMDRDGMPMMGGPMMWYVWVF